jgi:hypothetical protein
MRDKQVTLSIDKTDAVDLVVRWELDLSQELLLCRPNTDDARVVTRHVQLKGFKEVET